MPISINPAPLVKIGAIPTLVKIDSPAAASGGFQDVLKAAVGRVEEFGRTADQQVESFLSGDSEDLHRTIMATQRADLAFELFNQVRGKVVQAYQEIMRMQM
ncbi:MAG: flagellar hook-basal body complex protein FliE [Bryobacterales bacterium]|nr:flagellar hook-basal body complex protein FliE [Bryobacterales bacterium]